jgi:hypothetical protein
VEVELNSTRVAKKGESGTEGSTREYVVEFRQSRVEYVHMKEHSSSLILPPHRTGQGGLHSRLAAGAFLQVRLPGCRWEGSCMDAAFVFIRGVL